MANHSPYEYNYYVPSAEHGSGDDEDEKDKKGLKKKTSAIASVTGHISLNDSGKGGEISLRTAKGEVKSIRPIGLFSKDFELKKPTAEAKTTDQKEDDDNKKPVTAPVSPAGQMPPATLEQPLPPPTAESPYLQPLGPEDFMHSYPQAETHILPTAEKDDQDETEESDGVYSSTAQPQQAWPRPVIPPAYRAESQMPVFPPAESAPAEPAQTAEQLFTIDENNETQPLATTVQPEAFAAPLPQTAEWQPSQPEPEDNNTAAAGAGGGHGGHHGGNGNGPSNNNGRPAPVPPQPAGHNNGNFGGGMPPSSPNNAPGYNMPPSPNVGYGNYAPLPGPTETRVEPTPQNTVVEREVVTNNLDPTVPFLAAAGAVGFVAERHFRRKGDEKVAKAATAQNKKLQQQINALQANQLRANQQPTPAYNPNAAPPAHQAQPNQYPGYNHNLQPNVGPNPNVAPTPAPVRSAERPAPFGTAEAVGSGFAAPRTFGERPAQPMAPGEKSPQQQSAEQANIEAANEANQDVREEDIRKVRDAWLETHVNKNTGQVIERDYGQAYHQERRAEQFPGATNAAGDSNAHTSTQQQGLGAGAPVYAPMPQTSQPEPMLTAGSVNPSLPRPHQEPMLPQGAPRQIDPQHRLPRPHNPIVSNLTNPWFWLILGLLIIAYFGRSAL